MDGFILIDKPIGISSFGAVARVRRLLSDIDGKKHKVGHAGTLDPAASGLLILAIDKATKRIDEFMGLDKSYDACLMLGFESSTDDREGELTQFSALEPSIEDVARVLHDFVGPQQQVPPIFSAIKVHGRRAYDLARKGKIPEMKPRNITVYSIAPQSYEYPELRLSCNVSKGTYIRSLARDIGKSLGTGAYLSELRRTRIGDYDVSAATRIDQLNAQNILDQIRIL